MAFISIAEILDIIIMSAAIGYIFSKSFARFNVFKKQEFSYKRGITWNDFLFSIYLVGPAIILHEFGHKFVAMFLGYGATFHSPISIQHMLNPTLLFTDFFALLMVIALVSAYFGSGFIFFVPGYVALSSITPPFQQLLIAFAGPGLNLILWLGSKWLLKAGKIPQKYHLLAALTSRINMFLFILNMLPIPGFDGFKVFTSLFNLIM